MSLYGATKLSNEIIANALSKGSRTSVLGLRFFSVYGPWGRPDMAYFRIISNLISGTKFDLFGSGLKSRDFTYIDDVVESIFELTKVFDADYVGGISDIVNIGGGNPHSVIEMIDILEELTHKRITFERLANDSKDVDRTSASTLKLKSIIGVAPKISLREGLKRTFDWANQDEVRSRLPNWVN
jgi:UDP-glucuronate 4-epimerase